MRSPAEPTSSSSESAAATAGDPRVNPGVSRATLALGLLGSLLCYLAHPPVDWSWLAWIGPVAWFYLARLPQLPGRRPYRALWVAGFAFWMATVQWIRLPHPANIFGLFLLAAYLGLYLPAAVGLTRVAIFRLGIPLWLAAPIAWTGLEWLRARLFTGFLMASLAHTQVRFTSIIQIADTLGEYGVTFLIILVASAIAECIYQLSEPGRPRPHLPQRLLAATAPALIAFTAAYFYGYSTIMGFAAAANDPSEPHQSTIALIQSDMLADWKGAPGRDDAVMEQMAQLSRDAVAKHPGINLVVWPETMFRIPFHHTETPFEPKPEVKAMFAEGNDYLSRLAKELNAPVLVGLDRIFWSPPRDVQLTDEGSFSLIFEQFNSSAAFDRAGQLVGTYDKMHLLPFGEYIPFVRWLPFLRNYSPITGGAQPGVSPAAIELDGVVYSPNICYETALPQLIRRQVAQLSRQGKTPDVLVNLTNDAWYWGSSELDMHLASGVFRAVEMRTPLVVSANRGLSAHVDHLGRVVAATDRDVPASLVATVTLPPRSGEFPSPFAATGDWFALACLVCCMILAAIGWRSKKNGTRMNADSTDSRG